MRFSFFRNMTAPDYYVMILYANNEQQNLNVWVGESGNKSTLMKADNTHTIYTVEEELLLHISKGLIK